MKPSALSSCITTNLVQESRDFYLKYFGAKVAFDCGWYVSVEFGQRATSLQFMAPQPGQSLCNPAGLTYNFCVQDVDAEYQALTEAGIEVTVPLEDHPWGDRGFAINDPNGIVLYIYSDREPSDEFRQYLNPSAFV